MSRKIIREEILISGRNFILERVSNIDELFDELLNDEEKAEAIKDERIPYWCEVWASAVGLAQFIIEHPLFFKNKNVLEVGAGLGLPGIAATPFVDSITISDYIEEAVEFARRNWKLNHQSGNAMFEILDWRDTAAHQKKYDIILASDLAYEKAGFNALLAGLKNLLSKDGFILLSEPGRYIGKGFVEMLAKENLIMETKSYPVFLHEKDNTVTIYTLQFS